MSFSHPSSARRAVALAARMAVLVMALVPPAVHAQTPPAPSEAASAEQAFNLPAQPLSEALRAFARESNQQILFQSELTAGKTSVPVVGRFTPEAAIALLLRGSGLVARRSERGTWTVSAIANSESKADAGATGQLVMQRILIQGQRTLNVDLPRTENDAQPYVIIEGEDIRNSGAANVEEFIATRVSASQGRVVGSLGQPARSGLIDLRGLGTDETLVLIDGRRVTASVDVFEGFTQSPLRNIPLAAIERIEILAASAGGVYGGGATGGVVNVILRRDYQGLDVAVSTKGGFRGEQKQHRLELTGGFRLGEAGPRVTFVGSHTYTAPLTSAGYDFARSYDDRILQVIPDDGSNALRLRGAYGGTQVFSADGSPLTLADGRAIGSYFSSAPEGYAGIGSDGGDVFIDRAGRLNRQPGLHAVDKTNESYLSASLRHSFSRSLDGFVDLSRSTTRSSAKSVARETLFIAAGSPLNAFEQDVWATYQLPGLVNRSEDRNDTLDLKSGLIFRLPAEWTGSLETALSRAKFQRASPSQWVLVDSDAAAATAFVDPGLRQSAEVPGTLNISQREERPLRVKLTSLSARAGGPVWQIPGGPVSLSGTLERSKQTHSEIVDVSDFGAGQDVIWTPGASQSVTSAYAELRLPFVSSKNATPWARELELMAAVRQDNTRTRFAGINISVPSAQGPFPDPEYQENRLGEPYYTLALKYRPLSGLIVRSSVATGFRAPPLTAVQRQRSLQEAGEGQFGGLTDPRRGGAFLQGDDSGQLLYFSGGNPGLKPEQSKSLSAGFVVTSESLPGLRVSLDWTRIDKTDEINQFPLQFILDNEDRYPGRIVRAPNLPGDPVGFAGPIVELDLSAINIARTRVSAWDIKLDYDRDTTDWGAWRWFAAATYQSEFRRQGFPGDAYVSTAGYTFGPLKWRGSAGVEWTQGRWRVGLLGKYVHSYRVATSADDPAVDAQALQGSKKVPGQTVFDLSVGYELTGLPALLQKYGEISFGIQNLFDKKPANAFSEFGLSGEHDPRLRRYSLVYRQSF